MRFFGLIYTLIMLSFNCLKAQVNEYMRTTNEATLFGIGSVYDKDTYLSDEEYTGSGFSLVNERMKLLKTESLNWSRQQLFCLSISPTYNRAGTATNFLTFGDYMLNYHYHIKPISNLKIMFGGGGNGKLGLIYNTRNGNNPAAAKVEFDLNLSILAIYKMQLKKYPLVFRTQIDAPFLGAMFSPHYGQSYYEIFDLGNTDGIVQVSSFHNKQVIRSCLTVDFSIGNVTFRAGYYGSYYNTNVNNIKTHIKTHSFMLGWVKEFYTWSGKKRKKQKQINSSFY